MTPGSGVHTIRRPRLLRRRPARPSGSGPLRGSGPRRDCPTPAAGLRNDRDRPAGAARVAARSTGPTPSPVRGRSRSPPQGKKEDHAKGIQENFGTPNDTCKTPPSPPAPRPDPARPGPTSRDPRDRPRTRRLSRGGRGGRHPPPPGPGRGP